ncbi:MAG: hypothetical protein E7Z63_01910 [Thermoplasmata archaeon]|nr:hypothetical protein [Thermoplasmata archaeon]
MNCKGFMTGGLAILLVFIMVVSAFAVTVTDDSDAAISKATKDAADNDLESSYDASSIMTIGVGTLRWVSYFGHSSDVVCIDAGDANKASWNGKAYRSLFSFDQDGLVSQMSGANINPTESHIATYGMACHDHNGFSTANLEALQTWTSKPTVTIVSKTVYDGFSPELLSGLSNQTDVVVIEEVDTFLTSDGKLSDGFNKNLSILAAVFNDTARANTLANSITAIIDDINGMISGKTCKFEDAYVGSASNAGAKTLNWSVGKYVPFDLAGVKNGYSNAGTTATDAGSEAMSKATPSVLFLDLSGTAKYSDAASESTLTYASLNGTPIYTLLPYFWFGFNFDNALADAYILVYACYDGVMDFDECLSKVKAVFQAFYPEMSDGKTALDGFSSYYAKTGSKLTLDGQAYNYKDSKFTAVDRPAGDVVIPDDDKGDDGKDNTVLYIGAAAAIIAVAAIALLLFIRRN